jgi:hypothetical protein
MITSDHSRCRCQDPTAKRGWIYLNAFCPNRADHLPWEQYGFPQDAISVSAAAYGRAWLAGEYNDKMAPNMRPGYRPEARS